MAPKAIRRTLSAAHFPRYFVLFELAFLRYIGVETEIRASFGQNRYELSKIPERRNVTVALVSKLTSGVINASSTAVALMVF